jgi:predicted SAM-dependent methyltransferase
MVKVAGPGPTDHPAAGHRVVYVAETFAAVFVEAGFAVTLLEWWDASGVFNRTDWNIEDGPIYRSSLIDHRNEAFRNGQGPLGTSSLILDAIRPVHWR